MSLLRARSAEHLILGCAQRSYLHNSYPSTVLLANNFVIQRDSPNNDADMAGIAARILDQICEPMKEINVSFFKFHDALIQVQSYMLTILF